MERIYVIYNMKGQENIEFVIWGIPPGQIEEVVLLTSVEGEKITERDRAEKLMRHLQNVHNCTSCRIQEVNLMDNEIKMI